MYYFTVMSVVSGTWSDEVYSSRKNYLAPGDIELSSFSASLTPPIAGTKPDISPTSGDQDKYTVKVTYPSAYAYWFVRGAAGTWEYMKPTDTFVKGRLTR